MKSVTSADGTVIAYEQQGSGTALIIVDGATGSAAQTDCGPSRAASIAVRGAGPAADIQRVLPVANTSQVSEFASLAAPSRAR
jgi:hypothetical protein